MVAEAGVLAAAVVVAVAVVAAAAVVVSSRFSQFGCTRNGTSGAEIKILRPPTPPN